MSNAIQGALEKYPILKKLKIAGITSPEAKGKGNMLEHWSPGDKGNLQNPRPASLPLDSIGIEIYNPATSSNDVAADIVSHTLVNTDPNISKVYNNFKSSLNTNQKQFLYGDYMSEVNAAKTQGAESPGDFNSWVDRVGAPAALRGYLFNQYDKNAQQEFGYTPVQKQNLDFIGSYIQQGQ